MAITASYITMSKVERVWGGGEANETLESMEVLLLETAVWKGQRQMKIIISVIHAKEFLPQLLTQLFK